MNLTHKKYHHIIIILAKIGGRDEEVIQNVEVISPENKFRKNNEYFFRKGLNCIVLKHDGVVVT